MRLLKTLWEKEKMLVICIFYCFYTVFFPARDRNGYLTLFLNKQSLDTSKLKDFADDNFRFEENGRQFSKWVENTVEKGEIARYKQFLLFLVFSKDLNYRHVKIRACLGKG